MNSRNDQDRTGKRSARPSHLRSADEQPECRSSHLGALRPVWAWWQLPWRPFVSLVRLLAGRRPGCLQIGAGSRCIKGAVRESNEDRCYADQRRGLFIVADGMGGHAGGERASQTVIEVIAAQLTDLLDNPRSSHEQLAQAMIAAVFRANQELMAVALADSSLEGMGATVVVAVVWRGELLVCNVGDSRAYLLRGGELRQLTLDDTLVQGLVSAGALTVGEAARHPMRHVLVHSVCTRQLEKVLLVDKYRLRTGDRLVLASDGLTDAVDADALAAVATGHDDARAAVTALTDYAQQAGSRDNITCIVVDLFE